MQEPPVLVPEFFAASALLVAGVAVLEIACMVFALPLGKSGLVVALCLAPALVALAGAFASKDVAAALIRLVVIGPLTIALTLGLAEIMGWSLFHNDSVGWGPVVSSLPALFIFNTAAIAATASRLHRTRTINQVQ